MSDQNDAVLSFLLSLPNEDFVSQCYFRLLGRAPDGDGLTHYVEALAQGVPKAHLLAIIASSEEALTFAARRGVPPLSIEPQSEAALSGHQSPGIPVDSGAWNPGELSREDFVRSAYLALLGREADDGGLSTYTQALMGGHLSRARMVALMVESEEGLAHGAALPDWAAYELRAEAAVAEAALAAERASVAAESDLAHELHVTRTDEVPESHSAADARQVNNVGELLALDGYAFVVSAYMAILGRAADEGGLNHYCMLLEQGWSKMHVLMSLVQSDEGKAAGAKLAGLESQLKAYRKALRRSWGGWYYRSVLGVESDLPADRQLRAVSCVVSRR